MSTAGKVIMCKAAVAWAPKQPLVIEEIAVAPPQANEVRIKIVATGLCGTDLLLLETVPKEGYPVVLGHEGAGIVESVGPGVTECQPGDKVIPLFAAQCRECQFCKNFCKMTKAENRYVISEDKSSFSCRGQKVLQSMGTSTFSEYTVVQQECVAKIDPAAPLDKVCLLGCGISTGYGAAINTAKVEEGSTCAVFGLGAVGLAAVMGCKAAGAKRIIAVDTNPEKFEKAKVFGATDFVNPKDHSKPIHEVMREMTNGGVDFSLECVGSVNVMCIGVNYQWLVCVCVSGLVTERRCFNSTTDTDRWTHLEGLLFWSVGFKTKDGVSHMVKAYLNNEVKVDEFITHHLRLDQVNDALELLKQGKCIRTVLSSPVLEHPFA